MQKGLEHLIKIIGKRVTSVRGYPSNSKKNKTIEAKFILFDDRETVMELDEQDGYEYHDCNSNARSIRVVVDKKWWKQINDIYPYATNDEFCW